MDFKGKIDDHFGLTTKQKENIPIEVVNTNKKLLFSKKDQLLAPAKKQKLTIQPTISSFFASRRPTTSRSFPTHTRERDGRDSFFSYYSFYSFRGSITSQSRRIANGVSSRSTRMNNEGKFISRIGTHRIVEDDANCFTRATQEFSVERHQVAASSWMDHSPRHSQPHVVAYILPAE